MGACCGDARDNEVGSSLKKDKEKDKYVKKLLFLGSGGSGKSTLFKQLRNIHGAGYQLEDRMTFIDHIHAQIIDQMKLALDYMIFLAEEAEYAASAEEYAAKEDNPSYDNENEQKNESAVNASYRGLNELTESGRMASEMILAVKDTKLNADLAEQIKILWAEPEIKKIYSDRAITKIEDSSQYFWDAIDRIATAGYTPDERDMLLVRYRTTGVIEQTFTIQKNVFNVFDVGGQKSERKKWINCFEHVTAVIFVASLSCYDEVMFEQEDTNSMVDALALFDEICNNSWFEHTSIILFLNKKDLFADKIAAVSIKECPDFQAFDGDSTNFEDTTNFIRHAFTSKNKCTDKSIFTHLTCATDQSNVQKVFNDVQHIIIENSLMSAGLMGDVEGDGSGDENDGGPEDDGGPEQDYA